MSKNYPDTIPEQFRGEIYSDAYRRGWNHGHGIACHNVPTLGDRLFVEDMGRVTVDAENIREVHASACYSAESNSRQYSPFEFTAHEFNSAELGEDGEWDGDKEGLSDELWEAFEAGTNDAIAADLAEYTDDDYGIEPEKLWFSTSSGRIDLQMTLEQAKSASHQGRCDDDVAALSKEPGIAEQLAAIDPDTLRDELREYGSWDAEELADHEQNLQRLLWLAAGDIVEEHA